MFCTYLITYTGNLLPKYYLGSTSIRRLENGYRGSVSSRRWKGAWKTELQQNPDLFSYRVLSTHQSRREALDHETEMQDALDVVRDANFVNCAIARANGFFGMDVSRENHPMWSKRHTAQSKRQMSLNWDKTGTRRATTAEHMRKIGKTYGVFAGSHPCQAHVKEKLRQQKTGVPLTAQHRANISSATKAALAKPEIREKLGSGMRGKKRNSSSIAATASAHTGMKRSEETKAKLRAAWQKRKQLKEAT